ncbi:MAG: oligosaccharide flippase family protein [Chloroflexota bacterium]
MTAPAEETPQPVPTLLADELEATEIPDAELASGAAGPMVGSFVTTGVIQAIQAVVGVLLARILGPSHRGELAAVILWPTLMATIGSLGLAQSATYHASRAKQLGPVVGSALAFVAVDSVVLIAIGWAILPVVLSGHDASVVHDGQLFLTAFVPLNLLAVSMMSILNGSHRFAWFQSLRLIIIAGAGAGIIALAVGGKMTVASAAGAYIGGNAIGAFLALVVTLRSVGVSNVRFSRATSRGLLGFGLKSFLSQSMWTLNERVDQLVISVFFSATSLGLYVVAVTLTSLTTLIGFSAALVALPVVARIEAAGERARTARIIVSATLICATAASVPIFVAEPTLIRVLFGEGFVSAAGVGRVLLVAGVVFGLNRVLEALLQAVGRPLESSIGEGVALAVTAGGLAALLPTLGIMGAGVTSLLAYSASSAFMVRRVSGALDVSTASLLTPERGSVGRMRALVRQLPGIRRS